MPNVAVVGATGYLGGEILRVLSSHPRFQVTTAVSKSRAGEKLADVAPNLDGLGEVILTEGTSALDADVAFLAQPAGEAMKVVPGLLERGIRVVDLGPDYRLPDPAEYARVYGRPHDDPGNLPRAVYGLPELFGENVRSARLVANPGCYPTATLLAVAPLIERHAISGPLIVDAKSGTSGAGASPSATSHHPEAAATVLPYGTPEHRHSPEMRAVLDRLPGPRVSLVFVPHLVPLVRGILCSIYAHPTEAGGVAHFEAIYRERYRTSSFVRVGTVPKLPWAVGTNRCYLSVQSAGDAPVIFSAIDNLGKGGASQAVQNANLMMGWDESLGLTRSGFGV
ncbi:MAG: N-acetyl-gamma-glutamyl-phosphate reductase [Thermoplasmata archaeon]|nr:N-acetyl-gamma-glutamyl-phosphate reductase [Thermoplasmata archaeon]